MTAISLPRARRPRPIALLIASAALVAATQLATLIRPATPPPDSVTPTIDGPVSAPDAPIANAPASLERIDHAIAAWTQNLAANGRDFLSAGNLGHLYEARARLSGDVGDYARADDAANRSLAIEPKQLDVLALHARLALATHDFTRAIAEAESLDRTAPDQPAILAIVADARLELGDVDAAEATYERIQKIAPSPAVAARLARVAFLRGDPAGSVRQAESAHASAAAAGIAGPALSWYAYLAGTLNLAAGEPEAAASWFDRALEAWPGSYLALAGLARADAALGDTDAAMAGFRAAIAVAPQLDSLAALGDLLALQGDDRGARERYDTVRAVAQLQIAGGLAFNRQVVLFDVNHGMDVAAALVLAEQELVVRQDVYGYDALAWALLANGRAAEADQAMAEALALGTRDAMLLYHAGEIALALGDETRARDLLEQALAIRGALDPLTASRASASLDALR